MTRLPTLFISHGSPMLAIIDTPASRFLKTLGKEFERPKAILMVSAHWEAVTTPIVSVAERPATIHDFGNFSPELTTIQYPSPGAPDVAIRAANLLAEAGLPIKQSERGLDHGAWVPLHLMYPEADIPTFQLSLIRNGSTTDHERMGKALAPLRDEGILIIGSGSLTHNLHELHWHDVNAPASDWVKQFGDWMKAKLEAQQHDDLIHYRSRAPEAARNHPSEEHIMPLFVAMGAAGNHSKTTRLHSSTEYGVLEMDMYAFS